MHANVCILYIVPAWDATTIVKSIGPATFMDQAGSDYVLAGRVLHAGSIVLTHAVGGNRCRNEVQHGRDLERLS
jgi:hypothetical protein